MKAETETGTEQNMEHKLADGTNEMKQEYGRSGRKKKPRGPKPLLEIPEGKCHFYMRYKDRYCRMGAIPNSKFCGEHFAQDVEGNANLKRIPCPYDPEHTCFERDLTSHLRKCNMRPKEAQVYEKKGINADSMSNNNEVENNEKVDDDFVPFANLSVEELDQFIKLVQSVHKEFVPSIPQKFGIHPVVASEMVKTDIGDSAMKHLVQNASLLSLLEDHNLIQSSTSFVEFGSGRGALTFWVASASKDTSCHFVLLDRKSHRYKKEHQLKDLGLEIQRIRIDIQDLKLDAIPSFSATERTVGITKHLCGKATDLALRCILETNSQVSKVSGLVLATCCHHCCTYESFAGKEQIQKWGFTKKHFKYLTALVSWAVCGTGTSEFKIRGDGDNDDGENNNDDDATNKEPEVITNPRYAALNLDTDTRRRIGLQAKEILDYGRCMYIQSFGLTPTLYHYTDVATTRENVAIVATRV